MTGTASIQGIGADPSKKDPGKFTEPSRHDARSSLQASGGDRSGVFASESSSSSSRACTRHEARAARYLFSEPASPPPSEMPAIDPIHRFFIHPIYDASVPDRQARSGPRAIRLHGFDPSIHSTRTLPVLYKAPSR